MSRTTYSPFGKAVKKILIDLEWTQDYLADILDVSPAYLSAVLCRKKSLTPAFFARVESILVTQFYISGKQATPELLKLPDLYWVSQSSIKMSMQEMSDEDRSLITRFKRKFNSLSSEQKNAIAQLLAA